MKNALSSGKLSPTAEASARLVLEFAAVLAFHEAIVIDEYESLRVQRGKQALEAAHGPEIVQRLSPVLAGKLGRKIAILHAHHIDRQIVIFGDQHAVELQQPVLVVIAAASGHADQVLCRQIGFILQADIPAQAGAHAQLPDFAFGHLQMGGGQAIEDIVEKDGPKRPRSQPPKDNVARQRALRLQGIDDAENAVPAVLAQDTVAASVLQHLFRAVAANVS